MALYTLLPCATLCHPSPSISTNRGTPHHVNLLAVAPLTSLLHLSWHPSPRYSTYRGTPHHHSPHWAVALVPPEGRNGRLWHLAAQVEGPTLGEAVVACDAAHQRQQRLRGVG